MEILPTQTEEQIEEDLLLLHDTYPNLSRSQLLEAKENLDCYFDLAVRVFLRLERERTGDDFDTSSKTS